MSVFVYMCKIAFDQFYKWQLVDVLSRYSILALTFLSECSFLATSYKYILYSTVTIQYLYRRFFPFSVAILNVPNRIDFFAIFSVLLWIWQNNFSFQNYCTLSNGIFYAPAPE